MKSRFSREPLPAARWFRLAAWFLPVLMLTGCQMVKSIVRMPAQAVRAVTPGGQSQTIDLCALQTDLQRYADEFAARTIEALDAYAESVGTAEARSRVLRWKVTVNSALLTVVTGPNPQVNLIDGLALATLTRKSLERLEDQAESGQSFERLLEVSRNLEDYAWEHLAARAFTAEQQQELRDFLERWWEMNPAEQPIFFARPTESRALIRHTEQDGSRPGSVFTLVGLDPMAGLDPAVREVTQTRLLAERVMFMAQRMPFLLRWHFELLTDDLLRDERIAGVLTNTAHLAESAERISRAVESVSVMAAELPDRITSERRAILEAIQDKEQTLRELASGVSQTLAAGESMSASLNTTLTTFDALMERFDSGEPAGGSQPAAAKGEPFRILDYAQTATQLEAAARELTVLLQTLDQTLGSTNLAELPDQLGVAVELAQAGGREVVDHAFWRLFLLVVAVLAAALFYRWFAGRLSSATRQHGP